jgi:hypothetical protein
MSEVWQGKKWPPAPPGFLFLAPAFIEIGRHLFPNEWKDDWGGLEMPGLPPRMVRDADAATREYAHIVLSIGEESYSPDFEEPPASLPALGQTPLSQLGEFRPLAALGTQSATLPAVIGRPAGYWFTDQQWDFFRSFVHDQRERARPILAKVDVAAEWLYARVFTRQITPYILLAGKGGDWRASDVNDWLPPKVEVRGMRVRSCRLLPGVAAAPSGTHWIFVSKEELLAALAADRRSVPASPEPDADEHHRNINGRSGETMTAAQVQRATDFAANALRAHPYAKRDVLREDTRAAVGLVTENQWKTKIWPLAREQAGLARRKDPGRPKKSDG